MENVTGLEPMWLLDGRFVTGQLEEERIRRGHLTPPTVPLKQTQSQQKNLKIIVLVGGVLMRTNVSMWEST
jgi:hypothetical protein